jgi:hypothetical protein
MHRDAHGQRWSSFSRQTHAWQPTCVRKSMVGWSPRQVGCGSAGAKATATGVTAAASGTAAPCLARLRASAASTAGGSPESLRFSSAAAAGARSIELVISHTCCLLGIVRWSIAACSIHGNTTATDLSRGMHLRSVQVHPGSHAGGCSRAAAVVYADCMHCMTFRNLGSANSSRSP